MIFFYKKTKPPWFSLHFSFHKVLPVADHSSRAQWASSSAHCSSKRSQLLGAPQDIQPITISTATALSHSCRHPPAHLECNSAAIQGCSQRQWRSGRIQHHYAFIRSHFRWAFQCRTFTAAALCVDSKAGTGTEAFLCFKLFELSVPAISVTPLLWI